MSNPKQAFLETIYHLRTVEHVILYNDINEISTLEEKAVIDFMEGEYERECLDYPYTATAFSAAAALWAAKLVHVASQLYLFRKNDTTELSALLPFYEGPADAAAMLSADLCLRFLPSVIYALESADVNDPLIAIADQHLVRFPYSGIGRDGDFAPPDTETIVGNKCLLQLYLDRLTERKAAKWATQPVINRALSANLGNHQYELWRELNN